MNIKNDISIILNKILNKYNAYYGTIKMNSVDVKSSKYFDFNEENNKVGPKCEVGDNITITRYRNIFSKGCSKLVWRSFCD